MKRNYDVATFEMEPETCFGFLTVSALPPFRKQFTFSSFTYVQYLLSVMRRRISIDV